MLLPCFNEEVTISKVVRDFKNSLPDATIYVYDNNSTDRTAEIARGRRRDRPQGSRARGKATSSAPCSRDIDADVYVMADGDDTYPADAAPAMVAKVLEGYDMVIGDRLSSTYFQENKRPFHNFGNRLVARLHQPPVPCACHRHHDRIPRAFNFTFVKTYPVLSRGLRGWDGDDHPLAEQQPATLRDANPVTATAPKAQCPSWTP